MPRTVARPSPCPRCSGSVMTPRSAKRVSPPGVHARGAREPPLHDGADDEPVIELDERLVEIVLRGRAGELLDQRGVRGGQLPGAGIGPLGAQRRLLREGQEEQHVGVVQGDPVPLEPGPELPGLDVLAAREAELVRSRGGEREQRRALLEMQQRHGPPLRERGVDGDRHPVRCRGAGGIRDPLRVDERGEHEWGLPVGREKERVRSGRARGARPCSGRRPARALSGPDGRAASPRW